MSLIKHGLYLYDNLIFMVPSGTRNPIKQPYLNIKNFLDFYDTNDKNIMIINDPAVFTFTRKLANEFGVDFDPQGCLVTDGNSFNIESDLVLDEGESLFTKPKTKGISYHGIGMQIDPKNHNVFPILKAAESIFSVDEKGQVTNEAPILVAGYQVFSLIDYKNRV